MRSPRARGRRVAVIADGGGHGSVAADLRHGQRPRGAGVLATALVARIEPQLERAGSVGNPIDIIDGADGLASFTGIARACLESGEVDAVLLTGYYGGYALYSDEYREDEPREALAMAALQGELDRPIVVHSLFADAVGEGTDLRAHGLATYERGEQAVRALAALATAAAPARGRRPRPRRAAARHARLRRGAGAAARGRHRLRRRRPRARRRRGRRAGRPARALPRHAQGRRRAARAQVRLAAACASAWPTPTPCAQRRST